MAHVNSRVQKHRDALRRAGLRPVQIWVPDTHAPGFADECDRQARLVAKSEAGDVESDLIVEQALSDALADLEAREG